MAYFRFGCESCSVISAPTNGQNLDSEEVSGGYLQLDSSDPMAIYAQAHVKHFADLPQLVNDPYGRSKVYDMFPSGEFFLIIFVTEGDRMSDFQNWRCDQP